MMSFEILDTLSLPGNPDKANEDAFAAESGAAAVFDGATMVSDNLLPGLSDAAWIANFGARRLMAHLRDGIAPQAALRLALGDAEKSYAGLRRRPPKETYEIPFSSMMLAVARQDGFEALWFGDCAALVLHRNAEAEIVGEAFAKRQAEARRVKTLADAKGLAPAAGSSRAEFLPHLRAARNYANSGKGGWLFSPDPRAADHVSMQTLLAEGGTLVLLCSDGFLALASDYGLYDAKGLIEAALAKGLAALGGELRTLEGEDGEGRKFPRFKKSDDATAVLLRLV
jgi:hypothetical protein